MRDSGDGALCVYGSFTPQAVTGRRTATLVAPFSHYGSAKYEAELHKQNKQMFVSICVCAKGCTQRMVWIEQDTM